MSKNRKEIIKGFPETSKQWKVNYENEKEYSQEKIKQKLKDVIDQAIKCAISDFTFRTTKKKSNSNYKGGIDGLFFVLCNKEGCLLSEEFQNYFNSSVKNEAEFDEWHHDRCIDILNVLKEIYIDIHYGKAQKIVNMTFKYLYCIESFDEAYFTHCHIPLDSIILDWIWSIKDQLQNIFEDIKKNDPIHSLTSKGIIHGSFINWSNLDYDEKLIIKSDDGKQYYTYLFYQKLLRQYCKGTEYTPLKVEFIAWTQFQLECAEEELFKQVYLFLEKKEYDTQNVNKDELRLKAIRILNRDIELLDWSNLEYE